MMPHPTPKSRLESATSSTKKGKIPGLPLDTAAIWSAVIPVKAGIHAANLRKCAGDGLDSRFRGNDWRFERHSIPNDTATQEPAPVWK
jgi:hypothetical protein